MNNYIPRSNPKNTPDMQKKSNKSKLSGKLSKEIQRSILLSDKEKKYWLGLVPTMPNVMANIVFKIIRKKNALTDRYIETAMAGEPKINHLIELKAKIEKIKKRAFKMDEQAGQGKAEDILKELSDT